MKKKALQSTLKSSQSNVVGLNNIGSHKATTRRPLLQYLASTNTFLSSKHHIRSGENECDREFREERETNLPQSGPQIGFRCSNSSLPPSPNALITPLAVRAGPPLLDCDPFRSGGDGGIGGTRSGDSLNSPSMTAFSADVSRGHGISLKIRSSVQL